MELWGIMTLMAEGPAQRQGPGKPQPEGVHNLMPEDMGDEWLHRLDYASRKQGLTGDMALIGLLNRACPESQYRKTG